MGVGGPPQSWWLQQLFLGVLEAHVDSDSQPPAPAGTRAQQRLPIPAGCPVPPWGELGVAAAPVAATREIER